MDLQGRPDLIELRSGALSATVHPADGGRLGQLRADGRPLLRGPEDGRDLGWGYWGCYPLLPWSNRIPGGTIDFEGRRLDVPVSWSDGSALHGLTAAIPWRVEAAGTDRAEVAVEVSIGPYQVAGRQRFHLSNTELRLDLSVTNHGSERVPAGLGIHPWFCAGPVRVPADAAWPGPGPLPTGPPAPVAEDEDLRTLRVPPPMDRCYTDLTDTWAEVPGVRLDWEGPVTQVVVYSEDPAWVCVEPVTMANNGFALAADGVDGHGTVALGPGDTLAVTYRLTPT